MSGNYKMNAQRRYVPKVSPPNNPARRALAAMREVPFPEPHLSSPEQVSAASEVVTAEAITNSEGKAGDAIYEALLEEAATDKTHMEKGFRIANERIFLTYEGHLDKEEVLCFFRTLKKGTELKIVDGKEEVHVAHEVASSKTNYEHSHVYVVFRIPFKSSSARVFDFNGIHPNIKTIGSKKYEQNIWRYLCKEDHSNDHLLSRITKTTIFDRVCEQETTHDVMRLAKNPTEAAGLLLMFNLREREPLPYFEPKHTWQKDLAAEIIGVAPSRRKIVWIYGKNGDEGKTTFNEYMERCHNAFAFDDFKGDNNVAMNIQGGLNNGWNEHCIIVDLARGYREKQCVYSALEKLKNGALTATKYAGGRVRFRSPHIICFANYWPAVHRMSLDRWDLRELIKEGKHEDGSDDYVFARRSLDEVIADTNASNEMDQVESNMMQIFEGVKSGYPLLSPREVQIMVAERLLRSAQEWNPSTTTVTGH